MSSPSSSSLTSPSSSALPLAPGLSEGAKAGIALGVIVAVLLFLILLVLIFFPYRRNQHHSKQSPRIELGDDELADASTDAEKTIPSVPQTEALRGKTLPSELVTDNAPVEELVVAKGPMMELEELTDARGGPLKQSRSIDESSPAVCRQLSNRSRAATPLQTKEQYITCVGDFIKDNIPQFFDDPEESKERTENAALQADIIAEKYGLPPEFAPEVMKLAFYDFIFLCDDSSSMKDDEQCIPTLKDTLRRVAEFATMLEPTGISVRFLNHNEDFDGLVDAKEIEDTVAKVPFWGSTRLGGVLDDKIVQPLVVRKVKEENLKRPVLVVLITDGQPCGEAPDCLRNTIRDCKKTLELIGYGDTAVIFLISLVGDNEEAKTFLEGLQNDREIGDMVFCSTENLVTRLARYPQSSDVGYTAWLIKLFVAALGKQTEQQKKGRESRKAT